MVAILLSGKGVFGSQDQQGGFTLIAVLIILTILMIGFGVTSIVWHGVMERERERELLFVGHQFRNAIATYYRNTGMQYPLNISDLIAQSNSKSIGIHPLRKLYRDPVTGRAEWGSVRNQQGRLIGVYSLSQKLPIKQKGFIDQDKAFTAAVSYSDWKFIYTPPGIGAGLFMPRPSPFDGKLN
jgi:type II secretory pathway pseudopilin PulG